MVKSPVSLLALFLLNGAAQAQPAKSNPFLEAVRRRESAVKMVDITFHMKEYRPKNSPAPMANLALPDRAPAKSLAHDTVVESINRIVIQGDSTRYEGNHPIWNVSGGEYSPHKCINVTNDTAIKSFYPKGRGNNSQMAGAVSRSQRNSSMMNYYLLPIGLAFRGMNRNLTPNPVQLAKASTAQQLIEGRKCLEYVHNIGGEVRVSYLVDPQRDYNVARWTFSKRGKLITQIDTQYVHNNSFGWVPDIWNEHLYSSATGKLERRTEVRVTSCKFNEQLPASQFDIEFPPDTRLWIADEKQYYHVEEGGGLKPISPWGEPMQGPSTQEAWYRRYQWWIIGFLMAIVVVTLLVWNWYGRGSR